jgi:hypothetical protein
VIPSSLIPLLRAWIETLVYLETCDESVVDPDVAVKLIEGMMGPVIDLPNEDLLALISVAREMHDMPGRSIESREALNEIIDMLQNASG